MFVAMTKEPKLISLKNNIFTVQEFTPRKIHSVALMTKRRC